MTTMRAKLRVSSVRPLTNDEGKLGEELTFNAVAASAYPEDGSDENNSFARWTPSAEFRLTVQNPALFDQFTSGQEYYVDFTPVAQNQEQEAA